MDRRTALRLIGLTPLLSVFEFELRDVERAAAQVDALPAAVPYAPEFFTPHEWQTVHVLADLVIPRDEKSGSATDAKVPEFMDFMLNEGSQGRRNTMRNGLAWLDEESGRRFGTDFVSASYAQRRTLLDDISWPDRAPQQLASGVSFFNTFRDMTAAGFFSSRMGYEDLEYMGRAKASWPGCPQPALVKLGVDYSVMDRRI